MSNTGKICLAMLVKDEGAVIGRCLQSVKAIISSYYIIDTGSLDNTTQIIAEALEDIDGDLVKRPFSSFGQLREELYRQAGQRAEFVLFVDADETLALSDDKALDADLPDLGLVAIDFGTHCYRQLRLLRSALDVRCIGHVYETPVYADSHRPEPVSGFKLRNHRDGCRSENQQLPQTDTPHLLAELGTTQRDAEVLLQLAKLAHLSGQHNNAKNYLQRCIEVATDQEIIWQAYYQFGKSAMQSEGGDEIAIQSFMQAYELFPDRAEPLHKLIECLQKTGKHETAESLASVAKTICLPWDARYFEPACYDVQLPGR